MNFKFALKQQVRITELETKGVVTAQSVFDNGVMFRVRYFYNGEAKELYFYEWEITEIK